MTTNLPSGWSAKIYQFPARVRTAASGQRNDSNSAASQTPSRTVKVASGSCWYHEEAVQESDNPRRH